MLKHSRIDSRLIHGQVANFWTNSIGVQRICVVSQKVVENKLQVEMLKMAKPTGVKLSVLSPKTAYLRFHENSYKEDVLVIFDSFRSVYDFLAYQEEGENLINYLNVGNVATSEGKIQVKRSVYMSREEFELLLLLSEKIDKIDARMVPNDEEIDFVNLAKEKFMED